MAGTLTASSQSIENDPPTMGWSSWNTFGVNISETVIKQQAAAMVAKKLNAAGYKYVNIDDGYFGGRDDQGNLQIHKTRFPNGLKGLVDYIHRLNLKAGIYSDGGKNTCGSMFNGDVTGKGVGFYGHDQQDADFFFKDMGFDFIKVDFCGGSPYHNEERLQLNEKERYMAISKAIQNTGRTDVRMNICRWAYPGTWASSIAASWRTTGDINCSWESIRDIIAENLYLSAYCVDGKYNDMDMLEVGRTLTAEEDQTHFGMWCIMSSPLLIGCNITKLNTTALTLLKNADLIALNQDPLHLQAYVVQHKDGTYILTKDIEQLNGLTRAVAFYNPTDVNKTMTLDFSEVQLGGRVRMRDLCKRKDMDDTYGSFSVEVPAHGTRIYRLEAEQRLQRTLYEAETAFMSQYSEIEANKGSYDTNDKCSGGISVGWIGSGNDLIWRNVYSQYGGSYIMSVSYLSAENRIIRVQVNGGTSQVISNANSGGWDRVATKSVKVRLDPGMNTIRLYNTSAWMPNIDCMTITPDPTAIESISEEEKGSPTVYDLSGQETEAMKPGVKILRGKKYLVR
ncbi:MAG: carbohydrate-binding protein [Bacteroidaceae bacterium]|nr:carbohydrate-binding protein [Bacteroidaceae bacterium]